MLALWNTAQNWLSTHNVPERIIILMKDLIAFRMESSSMVNNVSAKESKVVPGLMKVHYHNKGIELLNLPRILNRKIVRDAVPQFMSNREPPMVTYTYTKTKYSIRER